MSHDLKALIEKLGPVPRRGLETAAALCVAQTHYNVEIEHLLTKLLDLPSDLDPVLRYYEVDKRTLLGQLEQALEGFDRGNSRTPAMSPQVLKMLREGLLLSSLHLGSETIRSGALLLALYEDETLRRTVVESCPVLAKIPREDLSENLRELIRESPEENGVPGTRKPTAGRGGRSAEADRGGDADGAAAPARAAAPS
ncbi:MAG TPA: type VI secretion system ATPase TssH, partial [Thermoanaerobaculia bacterium]